MCSRDLGLTSVYNLVLDPQVARGRRHLSASRPARPVGSGGTGRPTDGPTWVLEHDFHPVRGQGVRFTFSPRAAGEALDRLLELNKERYEAEVAAGLHEPAKPRQSKAANKAAAGQGSLLGDGR